MQIAGLEQGRPKDGQGRCAQELACYDLLDRLQIDYLRADHTAAATMEDCQAVEKALQGPICKNLFLCNRQKTQYYLLLMDGSKPFKTKFLSSQLGCARLSFAQPEDMERLLHTMPGSASALSLLFDPDELVQLVIDRSALQQPFFGCHPCKNTTSLKLKREDVLDKILPALGHTPVFVDLPDEAKV